jgi:hypothetical protein
MDILTVQDGQKRLRALEALAREGFSKSTEAFDTAILVIKQIQDEALWHFAVDTDGVRFMDYENPTFEAYLKHFCEDAGIPRSTLQYHLHTVRIFDALEIPRHLLQEAGVRRAAPVRNLVPYDGRRGTIDDLPDEVLERLPPGDTQKERLKQAVIEILVSPEIPLQPQDVRKAFRIDFAGKEEGGFIEVQDGLLFRWESESEIWSGILISGETLDSMPPGAKASLYKIVLRR